MQSTIALAAAVATTIACDDIRRDHRPALSHVASTAGRSMVTDSGSSRAVPPNATVAHRAPNGVNETCLYAAIRLRTVDLAKRLARKHDQGILHRDLDLERALADARVE